MTRNRILLCATILSGSLCSFAAHAQFGGGPAELDLIKVKDDLYVIHNEAVPGNVTALISDEGVLLVDNKFEVDYDNIVEMLRTVTEQPIRYVVNTHYHGDHSGGNAKMQGAGAEVVASSQARAKMVEVSQPGLPNITIEDRGTIHIGGKRAELYYFGRAHTDGDIIVYLPDHRVIVMGDTFTNGPGLAQLVDYAGGGSTRAWPETIERALMLDFDTAVPGHGPVATRRVLEDFHADSVRLRETVHTMITQNRPRQDIEAVLRNEFGFEDFHLQMAFDGMLVELR